jgi:hypothetical protein
VAALDGLVDLEVRRLLLTPTPLAEHVGDDEARG